MGTDYKLKHKYEEEQREKEQRERKQRQREQREREQREREQREREEYDRAIRARQEREMLRNREACMNKYGDEFMNCKVNPYNDKTECKSNYDAGINKCLTKFKGGKRKRRRKTKRKRRKKTKHKRCRKTRRRKTRRRKTRCK